MIVATKPGSGVGETVAFMGWRRFATQANATNPMLYANQMCGEGIVNVRIQKSRQLLDRFASSNPYSLRIPLSMTSPSIPFRFDRIGGGFRVIHAGF